MEQLNTTNSVGLDTAGDERKAIVETLQFIVISVGEEQYGIDIRYIDNIVRMQHITRVPKVSAYLKGVINLRGEVLPVMSIRLRMGLDADEITRASRIIILRSEQEGNVGVIVDEVKEVVTLPVNEIEKVSREAKDGKPVFISGIGKYNGELISLLDLSSITLEENV
ncbi:MAG: chemotaxis protein CheW [Acetatifactor sp.]|nr:chemotaxis protein CheW [Acetatifactor sp.]